MTRIFRCEYRFRDSAGYDNGTLKEFVEKLYHLGYSSFSQRVKVIEYQEFSNENEPDVPVEIDSTSLESTLQECIEQIDAIGAHRIAIDFPHSAGAMPDKRFSANATTELYDGLIGLADRYRQERGNESSHALYYPLSVGMGVCGYDGVRPRWQPRFTTGGDGYVADSSDFAEYLLSRNNRLQELAGLAGEVFKTKIDPVMVYLG